MIKNYQDQVCIVTGASSGIGEAFAVELVARGAYVVAFARRGERLAALAACLGERLLPVVGDVTQASDRAALIETTLTHWGRVNVLINNAGRGDGADHFSQLTPDLIDAVMNVNLISALHLTHALLPQLSADGGGLIINVSSPMSALGLTGHTLYNSSKAGLSAMSQTLKREFKPQGLHVMDFLPGFTRSEMITAQDEAHLPLRGLIPVKDADIVVKKALDAALRRRADYMSGGLAVRAAMRLNRSWPRLLDWASSYISH